MEWLMKDPEDDIEELNRQGFELEFVLPTNSKPSETASGADDFLSAVVSFPCRFFAMRAMARSYTHPFVLPEQQRDSEALATRSHVDLSQQSETEALDQVRAGTQPAAPIEEEAAEMQEGRSEARGRTFWLRCEWKLVESEAVRGRLLLAGFKIEPAEEQVGGCLPGWHAHWQAVARGRFDLVPSALARCLLESQVVRCQRCGSLFQRGCLGTDGDPCKGLCASVLV
eukprot:3517440-Rhodomonas_salina.1